MQTNLFNARNGEVQGTEKRRDFADKLCLQMQTMGARFADKVCLKMQTNFADKPLQDTPPPKCRQTSSKMQTRALGVWANCRRIMQTKVVCESGGDACILARLHNVAGVVYSENAVKVCLQFPADFLQTKFVCRACLQGLSARSGNADKVCLRA